MIAATLALLLAALAPSGVSAKDLNGRLGVGIERSLAGATGLAIRYFFSEAVGLSVTLGADLTIHDGDDDGTNEVDVGFQSAFGVAGHFARSLHAHFGAGLRVVVAQHPGLDPQLALEIPLLLEFFLSDHFSVGVSTGVLINFAPSSGQSLPGGRGDLPDGGVGVGFGGAGVAAAAAVLYYF